MWFLQNLANFWTFWQFRHLITLQKNLQKTHIFGFLAQLQTYNYFRKNRVLTVICSVMALIQNLKFLQFCYLGWQVLILQLLRICKEERYELYVLSYMGYMSYNHSTNLKQFKIFDLTPIGWSTMEWPYKQMLYFYRVQELLNKGSSNLPIKMMSYIVASNKSIVIVKKCWKMKKTVNFELLYCKTDINTFIVLRRANHSSD